MITTEQRYWIYEWNPKRGLLGGHLCYASAGPEEGVHDVAEAVFERFPDIQDIAIIHDAAISRYLQGRQAGAHELHFDTFYRHGPNASALVRTTADRQRERWDELQAENARIARELAERS